MALSGGAIAAIVISIYAIAVTIVLVFYFLKVKKLKKKNKQTTAKPSNQLEAPKPTPRDNAAPFNFVQVEYRNEQIGKVQSVPRAHDAPVTRHQRNESVDGLSFGSVISQSEGEPTKVEGNYVDPVGYLSAKSDSDSDDTLYGDVVTHTPKLKVRSGEKKVSISPTPSNDFFDVKEMESKDKPREYEISSGEITFHEEPIKETQGQKANTLPMINGQRDKEKNIMGSLPTLRTSKASSSSSSSSSSAESSPEMRPKTGSQIDRENARRSYQAAPEQYRKESSYLDPPAEVVVHSDVPIVPTENSRKSSSESQSNIVKVGNPTSRPSSRSSSSEDEADGVDRRAEIVIQRKVSVSSFSSNENVKTMIPVTSSRQTTHYSSDSGSTSRSPQMQPKPPLVRKDSETSSLSTVQIDHESDSEEEPQRALEKNFTSMSSLESSSSFKPENRQEYRVRSSYSNSSDSEADTSKPPQESLFTRMKNAFSFRLRSEDKPEVEVRQSGHQSDSRRSSSSSSTSNDEDGKSSTLRPKISQYEPQVMEKMNTSCSESEPEIKNPIQKATQMKHVSSSSSSESEPEIKNPIQNASQMERASSSSSSESEPEIKKPSQIKRNSSSSGSVSEPEIKHPIKNPSQMERVSSSSGSESEPEIKNTSQNAFQMERTSLSSSSESEPEIKHPSQMERVSSSSGSESEPEIKNRIQNATQMERDSLSSSSESDEEPFSSDFQSEKPPVKLMLKRDSISSSGEESENPEAPKVVRKESSSSSSSNGSLPKFTPRKSSFSSPSSISRKSINALNDFIVMEKGSSDGGDTLSISSTDSLVNEQKVIPFIAPRSPTSNNLVNNSLNLDLEPSGSDSDSSDNNLNGQPKLAKKISAFERKSSESDSSDEDEADRAFHTMKRITEPSKTRDSDSHSDSDSISISSREEEKMPKDNIRIIPNLNQKAFTLPQAVKTNRNVRLRRSSSTSSSGSGSQRNKGHSEVFHYDEKNRDSILRDLNLRYESVYPSRRASFLDKPQSKPDKSKTENFW